MEKMKIGLVGCGNISSIYLENLTKSFINTEVYAVADLVKERAEEAADKYNVPNVFTFEEMLACKEISIIVNLSTPKGHFDICKKSLEAGKHVYVEKPLSLQFEQGQQLLKIANENNLLIGCAPDTFLGAGLQTCRKAIDDGLIGNVVGATAFMVCHGHESWHPDPEFYYELGGGPMFDMGPYYLTALVSLIGPLKTVAGMTAISFAKRIITSEKKFGKIIDVEVPTHVAGTMQFTNGAIGSIITSFDVMGSTLPRIEIYGSTGTLIVPDPNTFGGDVRIKTYFNNDFETLPLTHIYADNSRGIGVADMAYSIQANKVNRANGEMACHVLEVMHAFHKSSDERKFVELVTKCNRPEPLPLGLVKGMIR